MLIDILEPMGAQFDRLRCEVCQNLFLRPMNTGFLRHAVATVLTVYGIETWTEHIIDYLMSFTLQQCLPFTVLKPKILLHSSLVQKVATVLTVYGIETCDSDTINFYKFRMVATVLTVYGIETNCFRHDSLLCNKCCNSAYRLRY